MGASAGALVKPIGMSAARAAPAMPNAAMPAAMSKSFFMAEVSVSIQGPLHCQPHVEEQCVVVACTNRGAIEFVVERVVESDAGVQPGPAWCLAGAEWDVGDLGDPAVAVRAEGAGKPGVENWIGGSPRVEILPGQHNAVIAAVGKGRLQVKRVQIVVQVGGAAQAERRIELLKLVDIAAAQREPVVVA